MCYLLFIDIKLGFRQIYLYSIVVVLLVTNNVIYYIFALYTRTYVV